jgi:hypothetical protein
VNAWAVGGVERDETRLDGDEHPRIGCRTPVSAASERAFVQRLVLRNDAIRAEALLRKARVLAALNHPNIGAIYGVEDPGPEAGAAATRALVHELVEGDTLAERIARGTPDSGVGRQAAQCQRPGQKVAPAEPAIGNTGRRYRAVSVLARKAVACYDRRRDGLEGGKKCVLRDFPDSLPKHPCSVPATS